MNGLSLLVALAAVGIEVGWEQTPSGNIYTIRIEALVVDTLRGGSAIESVVKQNERETLRQFRVVVGPKSQQSQRSAASTANEVQYGWSPNEAGGIDYYVQIGLERLETLSRGVPLDCIVHRDVPAVDKIFVFVGDGELPRKLPQGARSSSAAPRDLSSIGNASDGSVAPVSGTDTSQRYGNGEYGSQSNTQAGVPDPSRSGNYGGSASRGGLSNERPYGPAPSTDYRNQTTSPAGRYGQYADNTLPVPPLDNRGAGGYDYTRDQYAPRPEVVARQPTQQPLPQQGYAPPASHTAALPPQQYAQPAPTAPYAAAQPTYPVAGPTNPLGTDPYAATLAYQKAELEKSLQEAENGKKEAEREKADLAKELAAKEESPKSLILTTLALFASIGANAYLGWLAWSFFWRFRDAASDLSRARSNAFPAGSLASH